MSTQYRPLGRRRLSLTRLLSAPFAFEVRSRRSDQATQIRTRLEWLAAIARTFDPSDQAFITVLTEGGYLHLYLSRHGNVWGWERFGGNDPEPFNAWVESQGIDWRDEHDDDFYH